MSAKDIRSASALIDKLLTERLIEKGHLKIKGSKN